MQSNLEYGRNPLRRSCQVVGRSFPIFLSPQKTVRFPLKIWRKDVRQAFTKRSLRHTPVEPPLLLCGKTGPKVAGGSSSSISRSNRSFGRRVLRRWSLSWNSPWRCRKETTSFPWIYTRDTDTFVSIRPCGTGSCSVTPASTINVLHCPSACGGHPYGLKC